MTASLIDTLKAGAMFQNLNFFPDERSLLPRFDHADPQPSCDGAERISRRLGRQTPGPRAPHKARRCRRDAERDANDTSERHNRLQFWKSDQTCPFSYVDRQGGLGKLKRAEKILSGTSLEVSISDPMIYNFLSHFSLFSGKQEVFSFN
jgi:hypothetical protein